MNFRGKNIDPVRLWSNYCDIKGEGGNFLSLCFCPNPEHLNSRSPAFQINIKKPMVHCFGSCGISGSYEHAICLIEGLYDKYKVELGNTSRENLRAKSKAYAEARKIVYRISRTDGSRIVKSKIEIKPHASKDAGPAISKDTDENLGGYSYLPKRALEYLEKRGVSASSRSRWQIGFDEEQERITIPVFNKHNNLEFIIRRGILISQKPAYLYPDSSAKSALLFGTCNLDLDLVALEGLVLVEGAFDCILLHQHGFRNAVSILGSSLSLKQRNEIMRLNAKKIYLFFDNDVAGLRGMEKSAKMLSLKYQIKIPMYPKNTRGFDPASLSKKQIENAFRTPISLLRLRQKIKIAERKSIVV